MHNKLTYKYVKVQRMVQSKLYHVFEKYFPKKLPKDVLVEEQATWE